MRTQTKQALRAASAVVAVTLVAFFLHVDSPFWPAVTVFLLMATHSEATLIRAIVRIIFVLGGATLGLWLCSIFANSQIGIVLSIFFVGFVTTYFYLISRYPIAWLLGSATAFLILLTGQIAPGDVFDTAFWRCFEIPMAITVLLLFGYFIFPGTALEQLENALTTLCHLEQRLLHAIWNRYAQGSGEEVDRQLQKVKKQLDRVRELTDYTSNLRQHIGLQSSISERVLSEQVALVRKLEHVALITEETSAAQWAGIGQPFITAVCRLLGQANSFSNISEEELHRAEDAYIRLSIHLQERGFQGKERARAETFLREVDALLLTLRHIALLATGRKNASIIEQTPRASPDLRFWQRVKLGIDARMVQHAVRTGMAGVVAFYGWLLSGWYYARIGVVAVLFVGMERNVYFTWRKASIYLLAYLAGIGYAIFTLSTFVQEVLSFSMALFVGAFMFALAGCGPRNLAYFGLQGGIALSLGMVGSNRILPDVTIPMQRMGGVFVGVTSLMALTLLLWPITSRREFVEGLAQNFARLSQLIGLLRKKEFDSVAWETVTIQLVRCHKKNAQLAESLQKGWKQQLWQLQTTAILHVHALHSSIDMARVSAFLRDDAVVDHYLHLMESSCHHLAEGLMEGATLQSQELERQKHLVVEYLQKLRAEGQLRALSPTEAHHVIAFLVYSKELLKTLSQASRLEFIQASPTLTLQSSHA